jgi:hypothetical protein
LKDFGWLIHSVIAVAIMVAGWHSQDMITSLMVNFIIWLPREIMQHWRTFWTVFTKPHRIAEWAAPYAFGIISFIVLGRF